ncbi:MAG: O-antigen ligase family protein [Candidatus Contendobacter sp.]|nr:O-antigen ligase family protein [Candidatus Contendobacter sp.]
MKGPTSFLYANTALIGYYSTYHASSVPFSFYIFFYAKYNQRIGLTQSILYYIGIIGIFMTLIITQARASFLEFAALILLMHLMFRKIFIRVVWRILAAGCLAITIVLAIGSSFEGARGKINIDFFSTAIISIFSENVGDDSLQGSRGHRLDMWKNVLDRSMLTLETSIFGLGFSELLIDRPTGEGTVLRYPHNTYVSIIGFTGFFGLCLFLFLQIILTLYIVYQKKTDLQSALVIWYPFLPLGMSIGASFGTVFEAPFHSFIYYLLSGIAVGIVYAGKK